MSLTTILKENDQVTHNCRPDVGVGVITKIFDDGKVTAEFHDFPTTPIYTDKPYAVFTGISPNSLKKNSRTVKIHRKTTQQIEVWAQIFLSKQDKEKIKNFFINSIGIEERFVVKNMHITVYHSRRPMPGLSEVEEKVNIIVPSDDMRFMVMAPGGENPRPEYDPAKQKIGVRIHKQSIATPKIRALRERLLNYETEEVLKGRAPSTNSKSAFGAHHFQPHMSVLMAGSGVDRDLKLIGEPFRKVLGNLTFDSFKVEITTKSL